MAYENPPYRVDNCPSCEWHHDGDEVKGLDILEDFAGKYYVCMLTKEKVYITQ